MIRCGIGYARCAPALLHVHVFPGDIGQMPASGLILCILLHAHNYGCTLTRILFMDGVLCCCCDDVGPEGIPTIFPRFQVSSPPKIYLSTMTYIHLQIRKVTCAFFHQVRYLQAEALMGLPAHSLLGGWIICWHGSRLNTLCFGIPLSFFPRGRVGHVLSLYL